MLACFSGLSQSAEIQCYDKYFVSLNFIGFYRLRAYHPHRVKYVFSEHECRYLVQSDTDFFYYLSEKIKSLRI